MNAPSAPLTAARPRRQVPSRFQIIGPTISYFAQDNPSVSTCYSVNFVKFDAASPIPLLPPFFRPARSPRRTLPQAARGPAGGPTSLRHKGVSHWKDTRTGSIHCGSDLIRNGEKKRRCSRAAEMSVRSGDVSARRTCPHPASASVPARSRRRKGQAERRTA